MGLDIYFQEDIRRALVALERSNERAIRLAVTYGMSPAAARLYRDVYAGALADLGMAFGLVLPKAEEGTALMIPTTVETRMNTL